jgi:hypothetical protein
MLVSFRTLAVERTTNKGAHLIQSHGVPKNTDGAIRVCEGKRSPHDYANAGHGVPDTHKLDVDALAIRLLESFSKLQTFRIFPCVQFIGELHLCVVVSWKKANFV